MNEKIKELLSCIHSQRKFELMLFNVLLYQDTMACQRNLNWYSGKCKLKYHMNDVIHSTTGK